MLKKDCITLYWWLLPIIFGTYMIYQAFLQPASWDSIVAVILFLLAVSIPSISWAIGRYRKHTLFKLENTLPFVIEACQELQHLNLTLVMELETYLEFISFRFEGKGGRPIIQGLYDWQRGTNNIPTYAYVDHLENDEQGRWYWNFKTQWHRKRHTKITIGITYLATDSFEGHLVLGMGSKDEYKHNWFKFTVEKPRSKLLVCPNGCNITQTGSKFCGQCGAKLILR
jgi:hypothetical protein